MRREFHFLRHIPSRQIARRAMLAVRRHWEHRLKPNIGVAARLSDAAPLPLFPPLPSASKQSAEGWEFTFLNRTAHCGPAIDWSLPGSSSADQLWTMNLHYFEHCETLSDEQWSDLVHQWIDAHPPYGPGSTRAGWNAYALSLRVVSWLQQLAFRRARLDPDFVSIVAHSAAAQLVYLERHVETDIGGNHLFKNIVALLWGSAALDSTYATRWRRLGLALLRRELKQLLPDGMHYERSPSYHAQIIADCLHIRQALGRDPFDGLLDEVIRKGLQAAVDLAHPDGFASLFGDAGLHMARPPYQLCEAALAMGFQTPSPQQNFAYPDAGYFGIRFGHDVLLFDAGPLGPNSLPGHAHGDMFSFEWSVAGERVIVDQGVFEYVAGKRRQASRSAASHNTISAPGADQGEFFGAFRLGRRARLASRTVAIEDGRMTIEASHDGFIGPTPPVRHQRRIEATCRHLQIHDRLSRPIEDASASLLLAPQAVPVQRTDGSIEIGGFSVPIFLHAETGIHIEPAVWWPDMGVEIPTSRLRIPLRGSEGAFELRAGD